MTSAIDKLGVIPILIIHGNHDSADDLKKECEKYKNMIFFHGKIKKIKGVWFAGWGGDGFSLTDKKFEEETKRWDEKIKKNEKFVLFTHGPPHDTVFDKVWENSTGNKSYKQYIIKRKPLLYLTGHIHECELERELIGKKTLAMNLGPYGEVFEI